MDGLFSTHPNPQNRIEELERMARDMGGGQIQDGPWSISTPRAQGPWG
jgi:predicted Zn-dependent protease